MRRVRVIVGLVLAVALMCSQVQAQSTPVTACGTVIDVPGDYQLTGHLGPCAGDGVTITASNVNFDLAGFTITGVSSLPSCNTTPQIGINVTGDTGVQISGGTVTGFVDGIDLGASNARVYGMTVTDNCFFGMVVSDAENVMIETNTVTGSGNDGLLLLNAHTVTVHANSFAENHRFGVLLVAGATSTTIRDNRFTGNGLQAGGAAIAVLGGTTTQILRNLAQGNLAGIALHTSANLVQGNTTNDNQSVGIAISAVAGNNLVEGNTAKWNGTADLADVNPNCGTNLWQNNVFLTDDVAGGSDGGPGEGCITGVPSLPCTGSVCTMAGKTVFLAATGAVDVTGPLPDLGRVRGPVTVGDITLEGTNLFVGAGGNPQVRNGDWTPLLPGPDIALAGQSSTKELTVTFAQPVFTAGFDFVALATGPQVGQRFSDAAFTVTLTMGEQTFRELAFSAPTNVATFIGVREQMPFDRLQLRTRVGGLGTQAFGRFYAGISPVLIRPYDILVVDPGGGFIPAPSPPVLIKVSPADGFSTVISDFADGSQGLPGNTPFGVAVEASGHILVVDQNAGTNGRGALFRIDPVTGVRTVFHDFGNPGQATSGTPLGVDPTGVAADASGHILVIDPAAGTNGRGVLFRVDRGTGIRTLLNDFGNPQQGTPLGADPVGVAVEASGHILVIDPAAGTNGRGVLFRVDRGTRRRTLLSDFGDSKQGELGADPTGVAVEASGSILVVDQNAGTNDRGVLSRVDPKTGFRTRLNDFGDLRQGTQGIVGGANPGAVAVEPDGSILVSDRSLGALLGGALFRVGPVSGFRTLLTLIGRRPTGVAILP